MIFMKNMKNMKKRTTQSFSIDDLIYEDFLKIVNIKMINKSKLIESLIISFINDNKELIDKKEN